MFKDEYQRLLTMIEESLDVEKVSLEAILKEAVTFFETLRKEFPKAPKEEREEMIQMMSHLHAKLQEVAKKTAAASGMSEEELSAFAENPSNFTPEQWQMVQESRKELYKSARKFTSDLDRASGDQVADNQKMKKKPIRSKTRRSKRNEWKKS